MVTAMIYMSFLNFSDEVASKLTLSEKLESILTTGVGGYLLVFVILALIWFILALFGKFFDRKPKEEKTKVIEEVKAEPAPVAPVSEPVAPAPAEASDAAVVAAIVAAISAYSGKPAGGFRVVSFRKKH